MNRPIREFLKAICDVDGCGRKPVARGYCSAHYQRWNGGESPMDIPVRVPMRGATAEERIEAFTVKGEPDECWLWTRCMSGSGYGQVTVGEGRSARSAHVVAWERENGTKVPPGMVVRHRCDTPACVNPGHLLIGTQADNMADKVERMRHSYGEKSGNAKLREWEVLEIRDLYSQGDRNPVSVSARYGVSADTIRLIWKRKTWKHL